MRHAQQNGVTWTHHPFRYGWIDWQDSVFKTAALYHPPASYYFLDWIVKNSRSRP